MRVGQWAAPLSVLLFLVSLVACRRPQTDAVKIAAVDRVKIQVTEDGVYRLSLAQLRLAGLAADRLSAAEIHLSQAGTPVPYLIDQDALIFYGQAPTGRYSASRTYLVEAGQAGLIMDEVALPAAAAGPPQEHVTLTRHLEENHLYEARARDSDERDLWFWQTLGHRQAITLTVDLPAVAGGSGVVQLGLWGFTDDPGVDIDHDFDLFINGRYQDTIRWRGATHHRSDTFLPAGSLQTGANTIVLDNAAEGASAIDVMVFNWARLTYPAPPAASHDRLHFRATTGAVNLAGFSQRPLILDVTNPGAPALLTGWTFDSRGAHLATSHDAALVAVAALGFLAPAAVEPLRQGPWQQQQNQADFVIITTDELAPALAPLAAARRAQGLTTVIVPIVEIYDTFGFGETTPESIRAFLAYARQQWPEPPPGYVLLVGDATTDHLDYLGQAPRNHVPTLLAPVVHGGETASDARLADVDGDGRPDVAIGRWPVASIAAVKSLLARTLAYEQKTAARPAIFTIDAGEPYFADVAGRLRRESGFAEDQLQFLNSDQAGEVAAAWNEDAWLAAYIGHGSLAQWGKDSLFDLDAIAGLTNAPAIVLHLTCLSGLFAHPEQLSLAEAMLAHEYGPVLIVAATSLTLSQHQEPFALALLQNLHNPAVTRMGDAFHQAKLTLDTEANQSLREVSDTFVLLGDPTTPIMRP